MDKYWILSANDSVASRVVGTGKVAIDLIEMRCQEGKWYIKTKKNLTPGDLVCFYAVRKGVVAEAKVDSELFKNSNSGHPWGFAISGCKKLHIPIKLGKDTRPLVSLDMYKDNPSNWQVNLHNSPTEISKHDFDLLTGKAL
jgi:hypothetical protein